MKKSFLIFALIIVVIAAGVGIWIYDNTRTVLTVDNEIYELIKPDITTNGNATIVVEKMAYDIVRSDDKIVVTVYRAESPVKMITTYYVANNIITSTETEIHYSTKLEAKRDENDWANKKVEGNVVRGVDSTTQSTIGKEAETIIQNIQEAYKNLIYIER